jgi:hypothetical protein
VTLDFQSAEIRHRIGLKGEVRRRVVIGRFCGQNARAPAKVLISHAVAFRVISSPEQLRGFELLGFSDAYEQVH